MAKIVHGRANIEDVADRMNRFPNVERAFFQGLGMIVDFERIPVKEVLKTCLRVNACVVGNLVRRLKLGFMKTFAGFTRK
jgi:hypothetical protein